MRRLSTTGTCTPPSGSTRATLVAALVLGAGVYILLRADSGHTVASQRFASRPEFDVWTWIYAAYAAAAASVGFATFPAFKALSQATGRRATVTAVATCVAIATLAVVFNPDELSAYSPLWLQYDRVAIANLACLAFAIPSLSGLLLIHTHTITVRRQTVPCAAEGRAAMVVVEPLWLRTALQRFLVSFGVLISIGVTAVGALRGALVADGVPADKIPPTIIIAYGAAITGLAALLFVPTYVSWQGLVFDLRDQLHPIPENGLPSHDWHQGRSDFDALLSARLTPGSIFAAAFGILAPLASSLVTVLLGVR